HSPWLGEEELVELDGEQAFLFAVRVRGMHLANREWECDDGSFIHFAIDRFGEEHVSNLLAATSEEAINRFRESWLRDKEGKAEQSQHRSHRERMTAIPVEEIIRAADDESKCFWLRGWGRHANEADLQIVLQYLWSAWEPRVIANLLRVFAARALPEF